MKPFLIKSVVVKFFSRCFCDWFSLGCVLSPLKEKEEFSIYKKKTKIKYHNVGSNHDDLKENLKEKQLSRKGQSRIVHCLEIRLIFFWPVVVKCEGCECRWLLLELVWEFCFI